MFEPGTFFTLVFTIFPAIFAIAFAFGAGLAARRNAGNATFALIVSVVMLVTALVLVRMW